MTEAPTSSPGNTETDSASLSAYFQSKNAKRLLISQLTNTEIYEIFFYAKPLMIPFNHFVKNGLMNIAVNN